MLTAGASCLDITPPLGIGIRGYFTERTAANVHDPLLVRSFVLENGSDAVAIAVCDLIGVQRKYLDQVKERVAEHTDLRPEQVMIACTHTHTGPWTGEDDYTAWLIDRLADGLRVAWRAREAAEVGWGRAEEARLVFNRRYRMVDGSVQTNPGRQNPDVVEPAGPIDPEVGALILRRPNGEPLGVLGNYTLHYIGAPDGNDTLSADYFGYFSTMLQRLRGGCFVAALSNGAQGDINNIDVFGPGPRNKNYEHCERAGALVAANVLWAWNEADFSSDVELGAAQTELTLTPRPPATAEDFARAEDIERRLEAGEKVLMGERSFQRRIRRFEKEPPREHTTLVQAIRVGDLALVSAPGELFVELGLDLKRRSPFGQTQVLGLANDSIGYIPTRRAFAEGAYEPESSPYQPGFGEAIVDAGVELLNELHGG